MKNLNKREESLLTNLRKAKAQRENVELYGLNKKVVQSLIEKGYARLEIPRRLLWEIPREYLVAIA